MLYPHYCIGIFKGRHFLSTTGPSPIVQDLVKVAIHDKKGTIYLIHHAKENEFHFPAQRVAHGEQPIKVAQQLVSHLLSQTIDQDSLKDIGQMRYYQHGQLYTVHYFTLSIDQEPPTMPTHHYRAQTISLPDSECGFGIKVEDTISDDREDILHTFCDCYYYSVIAKSEYAPTLASAPYNYDPHSIQTQESYAVCLNPDEFCYTLTPMSKIHEQSVY